ncbi:ATP dependent RNA helicase and U5 mRNA splicing factor [Spathaspora passalidarum NRRL Y-27907]|uniref:ATP dependent RNA helicase and U5 mRNA splicing factor n=1 Tax=Spathaspora passalidarum (strain NRRL Y-27907 / 11-Y1) TaxID=619300 RepID=G3AL05_SPAPN|nr:ATP dependent RNA helicase and U5 mRNA splicing factor [Spathaspora passalidarum NRRL Y-27907]EGW33048.1 ATP dependent RNA helicase and U5 mRNA splicing factor [Spathaspora passalidarum NRRL Y-27907]
MAADDELYDEFGNLIGDEFDSDAESSNESLASVEEESDQASDEEEEELHADSTSLIKRTEEAGETIFIQPDEPMSNQPVIKPKIEKAMKIDFTANLSFTELEEKYKDLPELIYSRDFMISTMNQLPERIRNIAVVGNLHSGKSRFVDALILYTHSPSIKLKNTLKNFKPLRFMDNHKLEIEREVTIKSSPITLLLQDLKDKSYVFNIIDTPGHVDFQDETTAAISCSDGVVLVIDVVEGLTYRDKLLINQIMRENLPIVLVLNKFDRLILELKLPAKDCYLKLKYIVDDISEYINSNELISTYTHAPISPIRDVVFASSTFEFSFTLKSFSKLYLTNQKSQMDIEKFSQKLWGDIYYDAVNHKFTSKSDQLPRTFVSFILEPIYKIINYTLVSEPSQPKIAKLLWENFGVSLHKSEYKQDSQVLLKSVFHVVFNAHCGFVDTVSKSIPPPALEKDENFVGKVVKLIESPDGKAFSSLVRVYKGILKIGDKVKVYGDSFSENTEDFKIEVVEGIYIPGGRYKVPIREAGVGSLVIIDGIESIIKKGATISDPALSMPGVTPKYTSNSVFKIALEPVNPSELPILLDAMRKINKSYLASVITVEESGEHVILAPGQLYMDCILHDLRNFFTDGLEIRISDPMTKFSETCIDTSFTKIPVNTESNEISIIAEPVNDDKLSRAIESGKICLQQPTKVLSKTLRTEFGWDSLAARSVWAFGPDDLQLPNILLDDTLESETDKSNLLSVKDSIVLGFKWGVNEGPLCDEPIRNTKFRILDAVINGSELYKSSSQIIPLARRACYTGLLTATPKLMEPIYRLDATCTYRAISVVKELLKRRRGEFVREDPIPGTQLFSVLGYVPVIDSVGLEVDLKLHSQGQATCYLSFANWEVVPGDPLDQNCELPSLKPVPHESLARDFVLKTRRRKGLSGEPSLQKYIDPDLYIKLKEKGLVQ